METGAQTPSGATPTGEPPNPEEAQEAKDMQVFEKLRLARFLTPPVPNLSRFRNQTGLKYSLFSLLSNINKDVMNLAALAEACADNPKAKKPKFTFNINQGQRAKVYQWLIELKASFEFTDATPLLAMAFFDRFIAIHASIEEVLLPLIAVACLGLAEKMLECKRKCATQQCQDESGQLWQYQVLTFHLEVYSALELCRETFGHDYEAEMLCEAELKIFQQFGYELNHPTAVDLLLQFVHLDFTLAPKPDAERQARVFRRLRTRELEELVGRATEKVYQANFQIDIAHECSQMAVAMAALAFQVYFSASLREKGALDQAFQRLKQIYKCNISTVQFDRLIRDVNRVLLYLSSVENQQSMQRDGKCTLEKPIEVVESMIQKFMFSDEHQKQYTQEAVRDHLSNVQIEERSDEDGNVEDESVEDEVPNKVEGQVLVDPNKLIADNVVGRPDGGSFAMRSAVGKVLGEEPTPGGDPSSIHVRIGSMKDRVNLHRHQKSAATPVLEEHKFKLFPKEDQRKRARSPNENYESSSSGGSAYGKKRRSKSRSRKLRQSYDQNLSELSKPRAATEGKKVLVVIKKHRSTSRQSPVNSAQEHKRARQDKKVRKINKSIKSSVSHRSKTKDEMQDDGDYGQINESIQQIEQMGGIT